MFVGWFFPRCCVSKILRHGCVGFGIAGLISRTDVSWSECEENNGSQDYGTETTTVRIAVAQLRSDPTNPEANLETIATWAKFASTQGAKLLLTPELFVTSYNPTHPGHIAQDLTTPGGYVDQLCRISADSGIDIITGLHERVPTATDTTLVYNTNVWVTPSHDGMCSPDPSLGHITQHRPDVTRGVLRAVHRKTHVWGDQEAREFLPSENQFELVKFCGLNCAMIICYEVEFPEISRKLAMEGCQLILANSANADGYVSDSIVATRAAENGIFIASSNYPGPQFAGKSQIVAPNGVRLATASPHSPAMMFADIDTREIEKARLRNPYFRDRRPDLYVPRSPGL